jgi:ribosomal protein L11 methyltransferase
MVELLILCPEKGVEMLSDALQELGALSVSVEDADADTAAENPLFGEPGMTVDAEGWQRSRVVALFDSADKAVHCAQVCGEHEFFDGCELAGLRDVPEEDWVRVTQSQFDPIRVSDRLWIVPSWHEPPDASAKVIRLDPGLAFGTGSHPTTHMCLRWIDRQAFDAATVPADFRVLDYGCGSGILAIAAGLFLQDRAELVAVDLDPAAVHSTQFNAQANQVQLIAGLPEAATGAYDVILANILATPLKVLAPLLCGKLKAGGQLVLAGILERQEDELKAAYASHVALQVADRLDGWILMTARKDLHG